MSPPQPRGLVHSVQTRLKNQAQESGRPFAELLELYAIERFLHRLGRSPHRDQFVLKGALLLRHWLGTNTRPTRDIDLLGPADLGAKGLHDFLAGFMRLSVEDDGIEFALDSIAVEPIRAGIHGPWAARQIRRASGKNQAALSGGCRPWRCCIPQNRGPRARRTTWDAHGQCARVHTVHDGRGKTRGHGRAGEANSRTKDYYDLVALPRALAFDGPTLVESIHRTFARRATRIPTEPLEGLADAFASQPLHANRWRGFLAKNRLTVAEDDLIGVVATIRRFAQPVLDAARDDVPFRRQWPTGGPW